MAGDQCFAALNRRNSRNSVAITCSPRGRQRSNLTSPCLLLASKSPARRTVLERAGISFDWFDANIDEAGIKDVATANNASPHDIAQILADAKAMAGAMKNPDRVVLGCDQVLVCDGTLFDKPGDTAEVVSHLNAFKGRRHELVSAATLVEAGKIVWQVVDTATLSMRDLTDAYISDYVAAEGDSLLASVGAYRLESLGVQLFEEIQGNHFTILGLPLLPLMKELRNRGILPT